MKNFATDILIKEKAKKLFYIYGPKNVSVDNLANEAGVSKKTVYRFYKNKAAIVHDVTNDLIHSHEQLLGTSRETSKDAIDEVLKQDAGLPTVCESLRPAFFHDLEKYFPDEWNELEQYKLKVHRRIQENLDRGKEEELYRENLNTQLISDLRLQQLVNILQAKVLRGFKKNAGYMVDTITELQLRAITTDKGRKLLRKYLDKND